MAAIAKNGTPSLCSPNPPQSDIPTYTAGGAIAAADVISLHSDGLVYPATPSTTRIGVSAIAADIGDPVTPTRGQRFFYTSGGSPGTSVYLSQTVPGGLDTTQTGTDASLGFICDDGNRIQFYEKMMA